MKCIYCLDFPDGKRYVGSTKNLKQRLSRHRTPSSNSKANPELKEAILRGGYEVIILEQCPDDFTRSQLWAREIHYINLWWDYGILYNKIKKFEGGKKGRPSPRKGKNHSDESKAKMSASSATKGKAAWNRGKEHSAESRAKMSEAQRLRWEKHRQA